MGSAGGRGVEESWPLVGSSGDFYIILSLLVIWFHLWLVLVSCSNTLPSAGFGVGFGVAPPHPPLGARGFRSC